MGVLINHALIPTLGQFIGLTSCGGATARQEFITAYLVNELLSG